MNVNSNQPALTPEEQATVDALKKLMPFVTGKQLPAAFMQLNQHDMKVLIFHCVIAVIQTYLIGYKLENPQYAPMIQTILELLRRLIV